MNTTNAAPLSERWILASTDALPPRIVWNVAEDARLPHDDHVEMSGRLVSAIVRYGVDADRRLTVKRQIFWPQLRTRPGDVRGYTRRLIETTPRFLVDSAELDPATIPVARISFDGLLTFEHTPERGIVVTRTLLASRARRCVVENWRLTNTGTAPVQVAPAPFSSEEIASGVYGDYHLTTCWTDDTGTVPIALAPGQSVTYTAVFGARLADEPVVAVLDGETEERERRAFVTRITTEPGNGLLKTPDPVVNAAFAFAKLRAAESLFETAKMGLVHSPGGGNYYGGVWANDQAEYSGPFFAFLNDADVNEAAINAYRVFAANMTPEFKALPSSFEMEGTLPWSGAGDRGDAAMIASGLSRYLLTHGDRKLAEEFWPTLEWCLEFCRRKTNTEGVIASDSDELEGRFPAGKANLSTSSLAYDGLRRAAGLARSLGKRDAAIEYDRRADALATAIEAYFGATVEGFPTYRYYDGNTTLRAWICLPLVFGITSSEERRNGTINALFSPRLWTPDGLATEAGDKVFWDRSTLYGLRGVFFAGATEEAFAHLLPYTRRRLLGEHVPYPVEAYPENAQAHLSAESALYCRVFIEGLFGIVPTGLGSAFDLTPRLPATWDSAKITLTIGGTAVHIAVRRSSGDMQYARVSSERNVLLEQEATADTTLHVSALETTQDG